MKKKIALLIMSFACACTMLSSCSSVKGSKIVTEDGKLIARTYSSGETAGTEHGLLKECDVTLTVGKEEKTNVGAWLSPFSMGEGAMLGLEYEGADLYFDADCGAVRQLIQTEAFKFDKKDLTPETSVSSPCNIFWKNVELNNSTSVEVYDASIKVVAKQGSDIVGAALIKIHYDPPDREVEGKESAVYMTLEKSVSFPKVKGKAQNITEEYLNEFFGK